MMIAKLRLVSYHPDEYSMTEPPPASTGTLAEEVERGGRELRSISARPTISPPPWRALLLVPGSVLVVALLHVAHMDLVLLAAMPIGLAIVLPIPSTFFVRVVIAVGVVFCANCALAWMLGLVGIPFDVVPAVLGLAIPLTLAVAMGLLTPKLGPWFDGGDAIAFGAGLFVLIVLWLPAARDDTATLLSRLIANGEDNAGHLGIVHAILTQHGLLFGLAGQWTGRLLAGHTTYPPGFHLNVALGVSALGNLFGAANPGQLVQGYFYAAIALQAVWAATTVMGIRALGSLGRVPSTALAPVAFAVVLFFIFGPPGALLNWGFAPQAAALWMLTLGIFAAATSDLDTRPVVRLSLVLLAMVGTVWSWYLVAPVAGAAALAMTGLHRGALLRRWQMTLAVWTIGLALSMPPIVIGVISGAPGYINSNGGVYQLDRVFVGMLVLAALLCALLPARLPGHRGRVVNLACLLAGIALALGVHWLQVRTAGAASYYYEKVVYTVVIVSALGAGGFLLAGLSAGLAMLEVSAWRRAWLVLVFAGLIWLSTAAATTANPGRHYLSGTWVFGDVGMMHYLLGAAPPGDSRQVLLWSDKPQHDDYLGSRVAAALFLRNTDLRNNFVGVNAFIEDDQRLLQFLRASPYDLWIITRDPSLRLRLMAGGYSAADLNRIVIDTITEPEAETSSGVRLRSYDFSTRGLLPSLFRLR